MVNIRRTLLDVFELGLNDIEVNETPYFDCGHGKNMFKNLKKVVFTRKARSMLIRDGSKTYELQIIAKKL